MRNLRAWFDRNPIDLAYISMLKHDAYVALGASEKHGFPVVLRPEGAGETGDIAWQGWGNFGRRIGRMCRRADAFVAISKAIEQELDTAWVSGTMRPNPKAERSTSPERPRIVSIPNGVPIPDTAWQIRQGWRESPHAVFVGRLAPEKGLDILLGAWPIVRESFPSARLTLIGEGPERTRLEELARTLRIEDSVDLPGASDAEGVAEALRRSDLFVLPSREEGMSVALLEAMALGIPVVASSIPGNRRILSDFKHGRLAPVDDSAGLAEVILQQWTDFDRAYHMSRAARSRVEHEYSIAAVARKHLELFRRLIDEKATAEP
jgi:glycosyltransferase involved in cell wall biosynthesis